MHITLNKGRRTKRCKIGFSWTTLIFRAWVPLFRGDWLMFFLMLILTSGQESWSSRGVELRIYSNPSQWSNVSFTIGGILTIFLAAIYNRIYIWRLLRAGYDSNVEDRKLLFQNKFIDADGNLKPLFRKLEMRDFNCLWGLLLILFFLLAIPLIVQIVQGNFDPRFEIISR